MDNKKKKQLEKKLMAEKREILHDLMLESELFSDMSKEEDGDIVDLAFERIEKDKHMELTAVEKRKLEAVNTALAKLETDAFGVCETCGCKIRMARLDAIPYAANCITCQNNKEGHHRHAAGH